MNCPFFTKEGIMNRIKDAKRRREQQLKKRSTQIIIGVIILLCLFLVGFFGLNKAIGEDKSTDSKKTKQYSTENSKKEKAKKKSQESTVYIPETIVQKATISSNNVEIAGQKKEKTSVTISSIGDCTLGTDESFNQSTSLNAFYNSHGNKYFFQSVRPILEQDDLTIVNMEGTLTEEVTRENKTYAFKGPTEYASILSAGSVEIANLANNHSSDYGKKSYTDTIDALSTANIPSFGYDRTLLLDIKSVKVGVTGIYELADHLDRKAQVKQNIAALKKAGAQIIIVNFHWGMELEYTPNDTQKELAHLAVDEGADLVIGHHPHVLQGIEQYKEKYIAYSLGNFCFGGNSNPEDKDTIIFQQTFTLNKDKIEKDDNINIIPCSISSSTGLNDYCPTPLEGAEKQRVLENLETYSADL